MLLLVAVIVEENFNFFSQNLKQKEKSRADRRFQIFSEIQ